MICYRTFTNKNKNDTMLSHIKKIGTQMTQIGADKCIVVSWGRGAPDPRRREIDGAGAPSVPGMINRRLYGCTFTTQYLILHLSVIISRISVSSNQLSAVSNQLFFLKANA